MRRPDVLILDEPANGLDPAEVRDLRRHLAERAAAGATVLISSHQLAEVQQLASHIVVMNHGRLVAAGRLDDLLAAGGARQSLEDAYLAMTEGPDRAAL
jgi:ABC-type multidrug transport system ATPase subunit